MLPLSWLNRLPAGPFTANSESSRSRRGVTPPPLLLARRGRLRGDDLTAGLHQKGRRQVRSWRGPFHAMRERGAFASWSRPTGLGAWVRGRGVIEPPRSRRRCRSGATVLVVSGEGSRRDARGRVGRGPHRPLVGEADLRAAGEGRSVTASGVRGALAEEQAHQHPAPRGSPPGWCRVSGWRAPR